ncbi:MAG: class II aldolase/adducin family protein, partial [Lentisphaeria bacterium]|nr:class II aldolase/adducin family protein [Lentisphaeria bacterium]
LRPSDIMLVRPDGSIEGPHKPSCEYPFHSGIFRMCRDVKAILHAHPPALVSFSIAGMIPDTAVFPRTKRLCGDVGFAPYDVPGSDALGKKISAVFAQGPRTVVLENHGVCLGGNSLLEAYLRFETLDFCARTIYQATLLGGAKPLTDAQIEACSEDKNTAFSAFTPGPRSSAELELRATTAALVRRCVRQKLFTGASGVYAVRIEGDKFLVTPADCDRSNLQPDELVLIDGTGFEAGKTPDPRAWFFKAVFDAQPALNAVCAANPPAIGAYLISHAEFNPRVIPESFIQLRETPAFSFDDALAAPETVARTLSARHPVVLVRNDAVLTCGRTPLEAFDRLEVTDYSAQATIAARSFGGLRPITDTQVEDLVEAFNLPRG